MAELKDADIVIIGSGVVGTSIAYYLSRYQIGRVVLVETNTIGSGATSWAGSMISRLSLVQEQIPLVMETYRAIHELENELNSFTGGKKTGSLYLAGDEQSLRSVADIKTLAEEYGIRGEVLAAQHLKQLLPWLHASRVQDSFFVPDDICVDGYMLTSGYASMAMNYGAEIIQHQAVKKIVVENGVVTGVQLPDDQFISASIVIVAAGGWSNILTWPLGLALPMSPVRSIYWLTEANPKLYPSDSPVTFIPEAKAYVRPESNGLAIGLRDRESKNFHPRKLPENYQGYSFINDEAQWDILIRQGQALSEYFEGFYATPITKCISGISTYTPDHQPIVGRSEMIRGLYAATGCNGSGIALSGGIGRLIKEMVAGELTFMNTESFAPDRLPIQDPFDDDFRRQCSRARSQKLFG